MDRVASTRTEGDYVGLIRAVLEAESHAEARLAELVLAMFLLGQNYRLTPLDYQELFTFTSDSTELANSQSAFHDLALDHIRYLAAAGAIASADRPSGNRPGVLARVVRPAAQPLDRPPLVLDLAQGRNHALMRSRRRPSDLASRRDVHLPVSRSCQAVIAMPIAG